MRVALQHLEQSHILYLQEDYFLRGRVLREQLAEDLSYAIGHNVAALCFRARSQLEPMFQPVTKRFGLVPSDSDGRTRCQLTLWKREILLSVLRDGESAWEMESRGSERTRNLHILSYNRRDELPVPYLMSGIVRGLWNKEALAMCKANNIKICPYFRGTHSSNPLIGRWRRRTSRGRMQRSLAQQRGVPVDLEDHALEVS